MAKAVEKAPRRERSENINIDVFFEAAIAAGALALLYFVGWPLAQSFLKDFKLPDLSNLKLPTIPGRTTGGGTTPTTGGGGVTGGGTVGGEGIKWLAATGETVKIPPGRQDGESNRWSRNVIGWNTNGFEVTTYMTISGGMASGGHIGLKALGPNHSGSCGHKEGGQCCCWYDMGYRKNGAVQSQTERPHPNNHTHPCQGNCGNIGRTLDDGKPLGIKWLHKKEGNGWRLQGWVDKSGQVGANQWEPTYNILDTGQMLGNYKPPNELEIEIRISDVPAKNINHHGGPWARKI